MATITGGEKAAAYLRRLSNQLRGNPVVKVGFLAGATYPDGTGVAMVAAVNEFGASSRGQPPRPFFRTMVQRHEAEWPGAIANLMRRHDNDVQQTLTLLGEGVAGQLRQSIVELTDPPLAASTVKRKGNDKPLIDTGHMLNSVDFEVST
jgi:hypothetical protein